MIKVCISIGLVIHRVVPHKFLGYSSRVLLSVAVFDIAQQARTIFVVFGIAQRASTTFCSFSIAQQAGACNAVSCASLVAERAGISRASLWKVENGNPSVAMGIYAAVLHALNNMDRDPLLVAKDDVLGRQLQDLKLVTKKHAK